MGNARVQITFRPVFYKFGHSLTSRLVYQKTCRRLSLTVASKCPYRAFHGEAVTGRAMPPKGREASWPLGLDGVRASRPTCSAQRLLPNMGADVKVIFTATLLSIVLCSCAVHHDAYIHHNLVGPTVTGNDQHVIVAHVRND